MQFSDYNAFRVAMQHLIEGDDTRQGTFSTSTLDLIIGLGESRVYRDLRASTMVQPLSVAVASNSADLPADLLELKEVWFSGDRPLDIIPLERLRKLEADGFSGGVTSVAAQDGDTLRFWPPADGTLLGSYYAKHEPLATGTWADQTTFARYPELFLFSAMTEAQPFLGFEDLSANWNGRYVQALSDAMQDERMRVYGGGPLRVRAR